MTEDNYRRDVADPSDAALLRMKRAFDRGTGCHLTADMIKALSVTLVGQWWETFELNRESDL